MASDALRAIGTIVTHYNNDTLKDYLAEIESLKSQVKDLNLRLEKYERCVMKIRDETDKILGSCGSVTMYEHFLVLLDRLGIRSKMIEHILHEEIAFVIGQVPTQAIYGETWEWCKHLDLLELDEGVGDILTAYGYVLQPPTITWSCDFTGDIKSRRVYKRGDSTIIVYTGDDMNHIYDFCDNTYDGHSFSIGHTYAVKHRAHRQAKIKASTEDMERYMPRGFNFYSGCIQHNRIESSYPLDSPVNTFE